MTLSLSFDCSSLGFEDPFVLTEDCEQVGIWLGDGVIRPAFEARRKYAPDSAWVGGKQLLAVVRDQAELTFPVIVRAQNAAAVEGWVQAFEIVLWQFSYTATLDIDGVTYDYDCEPAVPVWGKISAPQRQINVRAGTVTIPVNP